MKKVISAVLATFMGAMLATSASAADLVLKFGHVGKPGSLFDLSANEFARIANAKLAGKAEVQVFGSSQLGKDKELLQKLKLGQIHFSLPSSVMSSVADEFGVFEMPYIIQSRDHMKRVQQGLGDTFQKAAEAKGYHILALGERFPAHYRQHSCHFRRFGIQLRTPKVLGVSRCSSYMAQTRHRWHSQVFTALQTGVIDGQENPYAQIASAKFQEVQKYLSILVMSTPQAIC